MAIASGVGVKKILFTLFAPLALFCLEVQPWFGDVYQFHFLGSYAYSRFPSFSHGNPQLNEMFQSNLVYLGLDFSPSPVWSIDADMQLADTSASDFYFRSIALQARYLWLDDIIGDPISLVTGASIRATSSTGLRDLSCPSHGNVDFELNFAFGKEFEASNDWLFRSWFYGAIGHSNQGAPWVKGIVSLETNIHDCHKWALFAQGINGYGRHVHVNIDHFYGYARIREKAIDLGIRYGYRLDVWGTLRLEYYRRVLAKSAPKDVDTFVVSYLLPFSF
jgi:hypothetical protein